jgi:hypothetical protein
MKAARPASLSLCHRRRDRAIQYSVASKAFSGGDYWMPAFAGMTNVDGRDKPGHDERN